MKLTKLIKTLLETDKDDVNFGDVEPQEKSEKVSRRTKVYSFSDLGDFNRGITGNVEELEGYKQKVRKYFYDLASIASVIARTEALAKNVTKDALAYILMYFFNLPDELPDGEAIRDIDTGEIIQPKRIRIEFKRKWWKYTEELAKSYSIRKKILVRDTEGSVRTTVIDLKLNIDDKQARDILGMMLMDYDGVRALLYDAHFYDEDKIFNALMLAFNKMANDSIKIFEELNNMIFSSEAATRSEVREYDEIKNSIRGALLQGYVSKQSSRYDRSIMTVAPNKSKDMDEYSDAYFENLNKTKSEIERKIRENIVNFRKRLLSQGGRIKGPASKKTAPSPKDTALYTILFYLACGVSSGSLPKDDKYFALKSYIIDNISGQGGSLAGTKDAEDPRILEELVLGLIGEKSYAGSVVINYQKKWLSPNELFNALIREHYLQVGKIQHKKFSTDRKEDK